MGGGALGRVGGRVHRSRCGPGSSWSRSTPRRQSASSPMSQTRSDRMSSSQTIRWRRGFSRAPDTVALDTSFVEPPPGGIGLPKSIDNCRRRRSRPDRVHVGDDGCTEGRGAHPCEPACERRVVADRMGVESGRTGSSTHSRCSTDTGSARRCSGHSTPGPRRSCFRGSIRARSQMRSRSTTGASSSVSRPCTTGLRQRRGAVSASRGSGWQSRVRRLSKPSFTRDRTTSGSVGSRALRDDRDASHGLQPG